MFHGISNLLYFLILSAFYKAFKPVGRILWYSFLGFKINIHKTKSWVESTVPFKVVHERPVEIPENWNTTFISLFKIVKISCEEVNSSRVMNLTVQAYNIISCKTILGYNDWKLVPLI